MRRAAAQLEEARGRCGGATALQDIVIPPRDARCALSKM